MSELHFHLPYPNKLTVNRIWKFVRGRVCLNKLVIKYRNDAYYLLLAHKHHFKDQPVAITIHVYPPDNRVRDIDNILKVVIDSLQFAKLFNNDSQVMELSVKKMTKVENGVLEIWVKSLA